MINVETFLVYIFFQPPDVFCLRTLQDKLLHYSRTEYVQNDSSLKMKHYYNTTEYAEHDTKNTLSLRKTRL
jgi:hypothetical protein